MDARTQAKIEVLGSAYQQDLLQLVAPEHLMARYGGSNPAPLRWAVGRTVGQAKRAGSGRRLAQGRGARACRSADALLRVRSARMQAFNCSDAHVAAPPSHPLPACSASPGPWRDAEVLTQLEAQRQERLATLGQAEGMTWPPLPSGVAAAGGQHTAAAVLAETQEGAALAVAAS